jgi:hypothetical protein
MFTARYIHYRRRLGIVAGQDPRSFTAITRHNCGSTNPWKNRLRPSSGKPPGGINSISRSVADPTRYAAMKALGSRTLNCRGPVLRLLCGFRAAGPRCKGKDIGRKDQTFLVSAPNLLSFRFEGESKVTRHYNALQRSASEVENLRLKVSMITDQHLERRPKRQDCPSS